MNVLHVRRFDDPDERAPFELGELALVRIGGRTLGFARYEPGWRWSDHIGRASGARWCQVAHVGIVLAGRNQVTMADGRELKLRPGDIFEIGPGHDSAVVGDEPYESLHLVGAELYAPSDRQSDRAAPSSNE